MEVRDKRHQLISNHLHDQGISSWVGSWDSDQTLISPSRNVFQMYAASELVTSYGTSPVSNACPPLTPNHSIFRVAKLLRDGEPARQTAANSAEGTVDRTRSAAAVGRGELTGGVVVPYRSSLLIHLGSNLVQDVGWQLSIGIGLRNAVTKLRRGITTVYHRWVLVRNWGLMGGNDWFSRRDMLGWCGVLMLMCVSELGMNVRGLGSTGDLLRMSLNNAILVDGKWGSIVNKLVARGRRRRDGGLAAFDRVDNGGVGDVFHFLGRAGVKIVLAIVVHILLIFLLSGGDNNFDLTIEHHAEAIATGGFLSTGNTRTIAPFVQLPTKGISLRLKRAKFTSSNQPVTARGVNVSNGRINDGRFGRATNLREVRQKGSEI